MGFFIWNQLFMYMIEKILRDRYADGLDSLDIYENSKSLILSKIKVKKGTKGNGTKIMNDLINYADSNYQIIALTPSSDFGGNLNRLRQFYKRFGFKYNKGIHKNYEFNYAMIRYPKVNETMKPTIKKLLREALDKTITCKKCGWSWKESESDKKDLYVCHKCNNDNSKKESINERLINKTDNDVKDLADFINFAKDFLGISDDIKVALAYERTPDLTTTAYYHLNGFIKVYAKDRATIDVYRSIAHELVHHKQNLEDRIKNGDGEDGTDIENEANSVAGVIIRKYGKLHPELYV